MRNMLQAIQWIDVFSPKCCADYSMSMRQPSQEMAASNSVMVSHTLTEDI